MKLNQLRKIIITHYRADIKDVDISYVEATGARDGKAGFHLIYNVTFRDPRLAPQSICCNYTRDMSQVTAAIMFRPFRGEVNSIIAKALAENSLTIINES